MMNINELINNTIIDFLNENEILDEGASDVMYHFTNSGALVNILRTNEFILTAAVGSNADFNINKNRFFFFSTTRSKSTGYKQGNVKLELDGRKLKYNYKFIPVDYWQHSKNRSDYSSDSDYIRALKSGEQEDRIVSNQPTIPNAVSYIQKFHINNDRLNNTTIDLIIRYCNQYSIPLNIYNNSNDFEKEVNQIDVSNIIVGSHEDDSPNHEYVNYRNRFSMRLATFIAYNSEDAYNQIINYLGDDELSTEFNNMLNDYTRNYYKINANYDYDTFPIIKTDIHNIRSSARKDDRFLLNLLVNDMKKHKVTNLKDYLKKKQWKDKYGWNYYQDMLYEYTVNNLYNTFNELIKNYLSEDIEIDGNYYNHAYESDELNNELIKYFKKLMSILKNIIYSTNAPIIDNTYYLSRTYIEEVFNYNDFDITNYLNVTEFKSDVTYTNDNIHRIFYYLLMNINDCYNKLIEYKKEYQNQFN